MVRFVCGIETELPVIPCHCDPVTLTLKDRIREERVAARRAVAEHVCRRETQALIEHLPLVVGGAAGVAAFAPMTDEPGFPDLPNALLRLCSTVLLPIARAVDGVALPLQWAPYRAGELVAAPYGLVEPRPPWLPPSALSSVHTVFVPALAVDRHGVRLGRGAGYYDRSLPLRGLGTRLIAVVRDDDVVDELPAESHDVPMTHVLTPGGGLQLVGT